MCSTFYELESLPRTGHFNKKPANEDKLEVKRACVVPHVETIILTLIRVKLQRRGGAGRGAAAGRLRCRAAVARSERRQRSSLALNTDRGRLDA